MFTQQPKIQYLHFKPYPDNKISSEKELTPRAAKRHETQKMMDTVKTAMAFILAHCPAMQQQRAAKNNRIFGTKTRGKRTGNWEVVKSKRED